MYLIEQRKVILNLLLRSMVYFVLGFEAWVSVDKNGKVGTPGIIGNPRKQKSRIFIAFPDGTSKRIDSVEDFEPEIAKWKQSNGM